VAIDILNKYIKEDANQMIIFSQLLQIKNLYKRVKKYVIFISQRENKLANWQLNRMGKK
jgi:hypothetical protein